MDFTLPLHPTSITSPRQQWLDSIANIALGASINFYVIATAADAPRSARATLTACATNPKTIICPCHRIVRKNGTTEHYGGDSSIAPFQKDNTALRAFLVDDEKTSSTAVRFF